MISFGIWNTKTEESTVEEELQEILNHIHLSVKLPDPLINHEIKNCTFLSPFQDRKLEVLSWFWTTDCRTLGSVIGQEMS